MSRKSISTIAQYVVFMGLAALLIWWQASGLTDRDKADILTAWQQVKGRMWLVIPVIIIGFLSHFFRALRWKLLLEPTGLRPTTINITGAVMIGYIVNLLIPRAGEVARCTVLARYEKQPADKIIGTIVAERSFDFLCLIVITLLAFALQASLLGGYMKSIINALAGKTQTLVIVGMGLLLFIVLLIWLYRRSKATRLRTFLAGMADGVRAILHMKRSGLFLIYSAAIWVCYWLLVYIGFQSMDATMGLDLRAALSVLVFGSVGMIVTPGGLGAYPIAVQRVLLLYAVPASMGLAYGWVSWLAQTLIILVFGITAFLVLPAYNRRRDAKINLDRA